MAFGQRHADRAGGDRTIQNIDMRLDVDFDTEPRRFARQQRRRSAAALAEMKIVTDGDAADSEPGDEIVVNEILSGGAGARAVEGHHHRAVETGAGEQPQLGVFVGQPELRRVGAEETAGCGSKVTAYAGLPSLRAMSMAAAITTRWPRWTPSKLPIATTAPRTISFWGVVSRMTEKLGVMITVRNPLEKSAGTVIPTRPLSQATAT